MTNAFSQAFRDMADRIERNDPAEFAGAVLIVPPDGEPIAVLMTDPKRDVEAFWSMASGKIQVATSELMAVKQGNAGFRR